MAGTCIRRASTFFLGVSSYNVLSAVPNERFRLIHSTLGTPVVCLQGTRRKAPDSLPCSVMHTAGYRVYQFGYGPKSNAHAGVSIALKHKKFSEDTVVLVDAPRDPKLQGRAGLVRVKSGSADFAILSVYLPPCFADNSIRRVWHSVMQWVSKSLDKLPSRCLPILCLDANSRVGKVACARGVAIDTSDAVGQCEPELETPAGHAFKTFLEGQFMSGANTYFSAGKTFYPTSLASKPSRVDYGCLPGSAVEASRVSSCLVNEEAGDCLQLIRGHARADHRPLQMHLDV